MINSQNQPDFTNGLFTDDEDKDQSTQDQKKEIIYTKSKKIEVKKWLEKVIVSFVSLKSVFRHSTRNFSHYVILLVFLVVISVGVLSGPVTGYQRKADPFLEEQTSIKVNEVSYIQTVATIAGIVDEDLGSQAYQVAQKNDIAPVLAVAGSGYLNVPVLAQTRASSDLPKNDIREYMVVDGDTLWTIARNFDLTTDSLRWANNITDENSVKPGQKLLIPPTVGVLYTVVAGDTLDSIANKYQASVPMIVSQNDLYGEDLAVGMKIMIPDGVGPEAPKPTPPTPTRVASSDRTSAAPSAVSYGRSTYNRFPYGYCTWYVASRRNIPWNGNAWQWYGNAIAHGSAVGRAPAPGAVMVTWESGIGHVALVESVNGSSFTVSEMNYAGWGRTSTRTITTSSVPLIGFIY